MEWSDVSRIGIGILIMGVLYSGIWFCAFLRKYFVKDKAWDMVKFKLEFGLLYDYRESLRIDPFSLLSYITELVVLAQKSHVEVIDWLKQNKEKFDHDLAKTIEDLSWYDVKNGHHFWQKIFFAFESNLYRARRECWEKWVKLGNNVLSYEDWSYFMFSEEYYQIREWIKEPAFDPSKLRLGRKVKTNQAFQQLVAELRQEFARKLAELIFKSFGDGTTSDDLKKFKSFLIQRAGGDLTACDIGKAEYADLWSAVSKRESLEGVTG